MSERDLGRLEEGLRNIEKLIDKAEVSRRQMYEKLDGMDTKITTIEHQVDQARRELNEMKPAIAEHNAMKQRVAGAGWLGRVLWTLGGLILGGAFWLYQNFPFK